MILGIETSTCNASLCLFDDGGVLWSHEFTSDRNHNSHIFAPVEQALDLCKRKLDLIAVGVGPGTYSGVRVGIAVGNGIGLALDVPVIGVSSLEAYESTVAEYRVVGDARRNSFFVAVINNSELQGEPELLNETDFGACLERNEAGAVFSMDQSLVDQHSCVELGFPTAANIAGRGSIKFRSEEYSPKPVEPHYLRPPYITKSKKKPVPGFPG